VRVWLIRHGQSESNAGLPTNGPAVTPLTAIGREQAERVAGAFTEPPALIVASPFIRARQTAEPTRRCFPAVVGGAVTHLPARLITGGGLTPERQDVTVAR
jgi:probable phosphoglycerate mutase